MTTIAPLYTTSVFATTPVKNWLKVLDAAVKVSDATGVDLALGWGHEPDQPVVNMGYGFQSPSKDALAGAITLYKQALLEIPGVSIGETPAWIREEEASSATS